MKLAYIYIFGDDFLDFLNRQFSNDLTELFSIDETIRQSWQYSCFCNAQGRVICSFVITPYQDGVLIIVKDDITDSFIKKLNMLRFRAKVYFEDVNTDIDLNDGDHTISSSDILKWKEFHFNNGFVFVGKELTEKYVAQHISLDEANAISFKKGCFPGQEIIARLHYKGKSKKSLQLIKLENNEPNAELFEVFLKDNIAINDKFEFEDRNYTVLDYVLINHQFWIQSVV